MIMLIMARSAAPPPQGSSACETGLASPSDLIMIIIIIMIIIVIIVVIVITVIIMIIRLLECELCIIIYRYNNNLETLK